MFWLFPAFLIVFGIVMHVRGMQKKQTGHGEPQPLEPGNLLPWTVLLPNCRYSNEESKPYLGPVRSPERYGEESRGHYFG